MLVACEFLLEELLKHLEAHMIKADAHWLRSRFAYVYKTSFENNKLQELQKWSNDIVVKYPNVIFESEEFTLIQENALISLIERDDLQMKEIDIWNYVIKWGIAKNSELPSNTNDWTRENFQTLKVTLKNCLPHIRYFQISGKDVVNNIRPYKKILEKEIWKDLSNKLMAPDQQISSKILPPRIILEQTLPTRTTEPFSKIITEEQKAEIVTWFDKKTNKYDTKSIPYDFKLLLRGSRDGFTKDTFWNLCDKKTNLVVVMRVRGTDEILGGYNPLCWDKSINDYHRCDESFVFSFKNGTSILSRIKNPQSALYSYSGYHGLSFGCGDLHMYDNADQASDGTFGCYCGITQYEKSIRVSNSTYLSVNEYEIFQIHSNNK
ncbi:hypothetical protein C2G38_115500 [Gigaspora rosea]|uniref:TLDc domain-containing protein n=1 Tax=Gigaspora rosea TaxID=44941 RepID=A0A397UM91_9GLOM|nr:hypothetical protein C2G38_115500 [Gigaspora rosea]